MPPESLHRVGKILHPGGGPALGIVGEVVLEDLGISPDGRRHITFVPKSTVILRDADDFADFERIFQSRFRPFPFSSYLFSEPLPPGFQPIDPGITRDQVFEMVLGTTALGFGLAGLATGASEFGAIAFGASAISTGKEIFDLRQGISSPLDVALSAAGMLPRRAGVAGTGTKLFYDIFAPQ